MVCLTKRDGILRDVKTKALYASKEIEESEVDELYDVFNGFYFREDKNSDSKIDIYEYFKLKSQKYCMYRIRSIEKGLVSFALIFQGNDKYYSIDLYNCNFFKQHISDETDFESYIPIDIVFEDGNSFSKTREFLKKKGYDIRSLIDCILDGFTNDIDVVIRDRGENIPALMASIQFAFPNNISNTIEFSIDYEGLYGILKLTNNNLEEIENQYVFDFIKGIKPTSIQSFKYSKLVEMAYYISFDTLKLFHEFIERFNYIRLDEGIEDLYNLFNIVNFGIGKMDYREAKSALDFCIKNASNELFEDILNKIIELLDKSYKDISTSQAEVLISFLFRGAERIKNKNLKSGIYSVFFNIIDYMIFYSEFNYNGILRFYKSVKSINNMNEYLEYSTGHRRMRFLINLMQSVPELHRVTFYFKLLLSDIMDAGYTWNDIYKIRGIEDFINSCVKRISAEEIGYDEILEITKKNPEFFSRISTAFYNELVSVEAVLKYIEIFSRHLEAMDKEHIIEVIEETARLKNGERFIFEEYEYAIEKMDNKEDIFYRYIDSENKGFYGYIKRFIPEMVSLYLKNLPNEKVNLECYKLTEFILSDDIFLDDYTTTFIIKGYEAYTPMYKPDAYNTSIIKKLIEFKNERRIRTFPDITKALYISILSEEKRGTKGINIRDIIEEGFSLEGIDDTRYKDYLGWCLPNIMNFIYSPEDCGLLINAMCVSGMEGDFLFECLKSIENEKIESNLLNDILFAYFYYLSPRFIFEGSAKIIEEADSRIIKLLINIPYSTLKKIDISLKQEFKKRGLSIPIQWDSIYKKSIGEQGEGMLKRIKNVFIRKKD